MTNIVVSVIKDNAVFEADLFSLGDSDIIKAEDAFVDYCRTHISNFDVYSSDDIDECIHMGIAEFGNGSVCLTWV
jgi:hypothetical protein